MRTQALREDVEETGCEIDWICLGSGSETVLVCCDMVMNCKVL
jgi:hypothetical protein